MHGVDCCVVGEGEGSTRCDRLTIGREKRGGKERDWWWEVGGGGGERRRREWETGCFEDGGGVDEVDEEVNMVVSFGCSDDLRA